MGGGELAAELTQVLPRGSAAESMRGTERVRNRCLGRLTRALTGPPPLALLLSALQFSARLRVRAPAVHRAVGRVVLGSVAVAGTAGLVLAPPGLVGRVGTSWGPDLLVAEWYPAAAARFHAVRRGTPPP